MKNNHPTEFSSDEYPDPKQKKRYKLGRPELIFTIIVGAAISAIPLRFAYTFLCFMGLIPNAELYNRTATQYARSTMREMACALESYHLDTQHYYPDKPYWGPFDGKAIETLGGDPTRWIDPHNREGSKDSWRQGRSVMGDRGGRIRVRGLDFQYYTDGKTFWTLVSRGPDLDLDLTPQILAQTKDQANWENRMTFLTDYYYDPSNGTVSNGDLIFIKQD